jgi:hypothetical protein
MGSIKSYRDVGITNDESDLNDTGAAASIQELISTIPRSYQVALGDHLQKKFRVAHKLANVQSTISDYERHKTQDSFPPLIRNSLKEPKLQFAKEWLQNHDGSSSPETFRAAVKKARFMALDVALAEKKKEAAYLALLIKPEPTVWNATVLNIGTKIATDCGGRVDKDALKGVPASAKTEYETMRSACETYTYRCMALARAAIDRTDLLKLSKMRLKTDTDAMVIDSEPPAQDSVIKLIKEELSAFKKELHQSKGELPPAAKRRKLTNHRQDELQASKPSWQVFSERQTKSKEELGRQEQSQQKEGKEMTVSAFLDQCSSEFRHWRSDEYPDVYTELNDASRMKIAVALLPVWHVDSIRTSRPSIFKFEGVFIPEDLEYSLAVNHKYIFHSSLDAHDVSQAAARFARTVRIRWQFRNTPSNPDYIPKFHVPNPTWQPQKASKAIEQGIEQAVEEIDSQVRRALSSTTSDTPFHGNMKWSTVRDYLQANNLMVKLTDKNLGIAAFPKDWYIHECNKMLGDPDSYGMANGLNVDQVYDNMMMQVQRWDLPSAMEKFLREKTSKEIPIFHAIPKVHKNPWTLRPIVPSHSWVTSRLSEIIDHLCRPIMARMPWIVHSTKEVIQKLESIKANSERCWIATGDVASFYTNINSSTCAKVLEGAWMKYETGSKIRSRSIREMIKFIMDNNYFRFQDQIWKQLGGLAMGTSCAPCLANIFAGFYERQGRVTSLPGVRIYVRYIDDVLMIFEGSEKDLMTTLKRIKLGTLVINWSCSRVKKEFLDLEIMNIRTVLGWSLVTRLFVKPMNKHLYIPWSSAHPLHVKKAFVKAELLRLALVSSEIEYFAESRRMFYGNLRRRGYPPKALDNWFSKVSYDSRATSLNARKEPEDFAPLMLSGQYNPVWEYIDPKKVIQTAMERWELEPELPDSLRQPLIRSLSRTNNLGDVLAAWNKTMLHASLIRPEANGA